MGGEMCRIILWLVTVKVSSLMFIYVVLTAISENGRAVPAFTVLLCSVLQDWSFQRTACLRWATSSPRRTSASSSPCRSSRSASSSTRRASVTLPAHSLWGGAPRSKPSSSSPPRETSSPASPKCRSEPPVLRRVVQRKDFRVFFLLFCFF